MSLFGNEISDSIEKSENQKFSFIENYKKHYPAVSHYQQPKSKIAIILNCCKVKDLTQDPIPCYLRYKGKDFNIIYDLIYKENRIVDVYIISAQYGLIPLEEKILNYNVAFNDLKEEEIKNLSNQFHIREDLEKVLNNHSIAFILFGKRYGYALDIENELNTDCTVVAFGKDMMKTLKCKNKIEIDVNINKLAKKVKGYRSANAKTFVIAEFLKRYSDEEIIEDNSIINKFIYKLYAKHKGKGNLFRKDDNNGIS